MQARSFILKEIKKTMTNALGKVVSGVDFPATKQDLIRRAKRNKASETIINQLNSLPDIRFNSLQRVWDILDTGPTRASDVTVSPAQNAFFYETLEGALKELHFPATKEQLLEESKSILFMWGQKDVLFPLRDVIEDLEEEEYEKPEEIMNEINAFIQKETGKL